MVLKEETFYPFDGRVAISISISGACGKSRFPLELRIPSWCAEATVTVNGRPVRAAGGGKLKIEESWKDGDSVVLEFPMSVTTSRWYDNSTVVERGPLVYALKMDEKWSVKEFDGADWEKYGPSYYEVTSNSVWNYGMRARDLDFQLVEQRSYDGSYPWNVENAPVVLRAKAVVLPDWKACNGSVGPIPYFTEDGDDTAGNAWIELIPYGCTTLRITAFPTR